MARGWSKTPLLKASGEYWVIIPTVCYVEDFPLIVLLFLNLLTDRRYIQYDPENPWDPASFRHSTQSGDFQLESLQLEDVLITVYQPGSFRPYTSSIFRADIKTFRKQWMFYDFLSAENVVGQFDNCLFSLHKPQSIGRTTEQELRDGAWSRMVSELYFFPSLVLNIGFSQEFELTVSTLTTFNGLQLWKVL